MATVVPDPKGLARIAELARDFHEDVVEDMADESRRLAPVDTGQLRENISVERADGDDLQIVSRRPIGPSGVPLFIEFGTRPHTIEPEDREALSWPGAGHPVKRVNHPGTRAQPYLRPPMYRRAAQ